MEAFIKMVRAYLRLIDTCDTSTPREFLGACAVLLPQIYAAGIELPDVELPEQEFEFAPRMFNSPMSRIGSLLGKYDEYAEVFDPVFDREFLVTISRTTSARSHVSLLHVLRRGPKPLSLGR